MILKIDAASWPALSSLLDEVLDLQPDQRMSWIEQLDPAHDELKPKLRALLQRGAQVETADFLQTIVRIPAGPDLEFATPSPTGVAGERFGPYQLLRELGSGGMGSVWLAERTDGLINRPVALKLPHGPWRRFGLAERLAREREILATLNHPNIAALYDAGISPEGQPYLALEYVEGQPIDQYCKERSLPVRSVIALFLQVADAVAYAHSKLVIHRDIKPSNILVTAAGQVRLLDFGIAKLLDNGIGEKSDLTEMSGRALTLEYAAPEQIAGKPIAIAADIYSLALVLYELLTGVRPFKLEHRSRAALEEAILGTEPARPSDRVARERRKSLKGDLDTIILTALRKEPDDRYPTVNAFADDLIRHLQHEPVRAQPDSSWYRAKKFFMRNKIAVLSASGVLASLVILSGIALYQARSALAQQQRAEEVKNIIAGIFSDANPYQRGSGKALTGVELLRLATNKLDQLGDVAPEVRHELANVLAASLLSLEDAKNAQAVLQKMLAEPAASMNPTHPQVLLTHRLQAQSHRMLSQPVLAREEMDRILPALRQREAEEPGELVAGLLERMKIAARERQQEEAAAFGSEALEIIRTRLDDRSPHKQELLTLFYSVHRFRGLFAQSTAAAHGAYQAAREHHASEPDHPSILDARFFYAAALADEGHPQRAVPEFRAVFVGLQKLFGESSKHLGLRLSSSATRIADAGYLDEALANAQRASAILTADAPAGSRLYAASNENVGLIQLAARRGTEAAELLALAQDGFRREYGAMHETVMNLQRDRSLALIYAGRLAEAEAAMAEVQSLYPTMATDRHDFAAHVVGVARRAAGKHAEALQLQERALLSVRDLEADALVHARILKEIGLNRLEIGQHAEAQAVLQQAQSIFAAAQAVMTPDHADALVGLGRAQMAAGAVEAALPFFEKAEAFWSEFGADIRWAGESALWLGRCYQKLDRHSDAKIALRRARSILIKSHWTGDIESVQSIAP
ncbi:MAG: protein kinase [Steroidobacteraceae bacterium]|nr:protein kinase [Steroidobacteraceae bacterium]